MADSGAPAGPHPPHGWSSGAPTPRPEDTPADSTPHAPRPRRPPREPSLPRAPRPRLAPRARRKRISPKSHIDSYTVSVYNRPMDERGQLLSIQDLSDRAQTPVRTIRFYITERLLAGPEGRGTSTFYTEDHLLRLRLIRQLARRHVPLTEIRERLERISPRELAGVIAEEEQRGAEAEQVKAASPREYISRLLEDARRDEAPVLPAHRDLGHEAWLRIPLAEGVELHVTQAAQAEHGEVVEELVEIARRLTQGLRGSRGKRGNR
jgi:DNA-binding transcriptional MerR regulator